MCLKRLEDVESTEEFIRKEVKRLEEAARQVHEKVNIKRNEIEIYQDKALHCKHENNLIEATLENRNGELRALIEKHKENEDRVKRRSNH